MSETKRGEFWIDGDDTHKVQGVLTYGSGIPGTLELSGHLPAPFSSTSMQNTTPMRNILGSVEGGMQCVTLRDCFKTLSSGFPDMPGATQKYLCNRVFKGKLMFPNAEQINAESLTVSMWPLTEWAHGKDLVEVDLFRTRQELQSATFLPDERVTVPGCRSETLGFTVEIWRSAGLWGGDNQKGTWLKAEPRSWFKLIPESAATSVESLMVAAHKLQLMLAMFADVPAVVNGVHFISPYDDIESKDDWMRNVEFFQEWMGGPPSDDGKDTQVSLFSSVLMRQVGHDIIREWFNLCDNYHPAVNWLLSPYFNPRLPIDIQFDIAFKAVERLLSQHLGPGRPRDHGTRDYRKGESRASASSLVQFIECAGLSDARWFKNMDDDARLEWASRVMEMRDKHTAHLDWEGSLQHPEDIAFYQQAKLLACLGVGFLMKRMKIQGAVITEALDHRLRF